MGTLVPSLMSAERQNFGRQVHSTEYPMSKQAKSSIVFVHGLWADGSCFGELIPTLQSEGHEVIAAQFKARRMSCF